MPRTNEEIKKNRPSDRKADQQTVTNRLTDRSKDRWIKRERQTEILTDKQIDVILFLFLSSTVTPPSYFFNEAFVFFSSCGRSNTAGLHPNQK